MPEEITPEDSSIESKLAYKVDFAWSKFNDEQRKLARIFVHDYMIFLREARTERERVVFAERIAQGEGFKKLELGLDVTGPVTPGSLQPGAKVYYINRKKNIALFIIGDSSIPMTKEVRLVGAHADFPRIDLKVRPLYEDDKCGVALLKTHYYGGLKKYQFATIPLALTGVVVKRDGTVVNVEVGLDQEDPVFTIPDLLIHLGRTV
nr:hypothetical protein [Candidatus Sigynarchaeota archaeon]